ncbi:hypothetical protein LW347_16460 [Pectobacterium polonicum]|uniref:Uncharacterized protein n=1 Tax=Pectobacterium polonicum TaxID=2485124 RepID=A0AAE9SZ50_9GAMM|nr:hypothetical protein [Pectobacterium polonicum]UVO07446.1 hypothetical protein LW347_16460 [Pectobacterium polonicum]
MPKSGQHVIKIVIKIKKRVLLSRNTRLFIATIYATTIRPARNNLSVLLSLFLTSD